MTSSDELRFDGRTAVVTGGGRGVGRAHAILLAARGARVVVNNRTGSAAQEVVDVITAAGGQAVVDTADIAQDGAPAALIAHALDAFGSIDIVVHNAGISIRTKVEDLTLAQFDLMMRTHTTASFFLAQAAWPHMIAQGRGRILLTASGAGFWSQTDNHDYSAAKAGVKALAHSLGLSGRPHNINVNCLAPRAGTDLAARTVKDPYILDRLMNHMPPGKIAPLAAWLTHDDCTVTGEAFDAGGGLVRRVFTGLTPGYAAEDLTPEAVRDHFAQIMDETGYTVPDHCMDVALDTWEPQP